MALVPETPPRNLTQEEIQAYRRDGVICIRGLYSAKWVELAAAAIDEICAAPPLLGNPVPSGKVRGDPNSWLVNDKMRDFCLFGPSAFIARQAFGSQKVNFFYDQIFVKQVLTPDPTPWHHDFTFWPLEGDQIASIWTSVDAVTAESSALEFVAGSHLWPQRYKAVGIGGIILSTEPLEDLPPIEADRGAYDILSWDVEPGDALLFHALTLHGAQGNRSAQTRRRAVTTRWCGDGVLYRPRSKLTTPWDPGLDAGDPIGGWLYPQVLPKMKQSEVGRRLAAPILPDPEALAKIRHYRQNVERVEV